MEPYHPVMAYRRTPFALNEWYHCFNRGIDKRRVFQEPRDFKRFLELLYVSNSIEPITREHFYYLPHDSILAIPRSKPLVHIGAYCLMPNHFHLLLQEAEEGGITKFMHKVGTGYTMYFNGLNDRVGNLFIKPFRSKHIKNDRYLRRVVQYIHLNPVEIYEPQWKKGKIKDMQSLEKKLLAYRYSSLSAYYQHEKAEHNILDSKSLDFLKANLPSLRSTLRETAKYYEEVQSEF